MVQVKKKEVHDAILRSATELFETRGYTASTLSAIAEGANVAVASIYSYFPSKINILYEIHRPWLESWLLDLEKEVRAAPTPHEKLKKLLIGFWHDHPARNPGLANSLMEALATNDVRRGKPNNQLQWLEDRTTALMRDFFPCNNQKVLDDNLLAHVVVMAQDGFIINYRWGDVREIDALAGLLSEIILRGSAVVSESE